MDKNTTLEITYDIHAHAFVVPSGVAPDHIVKELEALIQVVSTYKDLDSTTLWFQEYYHKGDERLGLLCAIISILEERNGKIDPSILGLFFKKNISWVHARRTQHANYENFHGKENQEYLFLRRAIKNRFNELQLPSPPQVIDEVPVVEISTPVLIKKTSGSFPKKSKVIVRPEPPVLTELSLLPDLKEYLSFEDFSELVFKAIEHVFDLPKDVVRTKTRKMDYYQARYMAYVVSVELYTEVVSYDTIARTFGGNNHTNICHGRKTHTNYLTYRDYRLKYIAFKNYLVRLVDVALVDLRIDLISTVSFSDIPDFLIKKHVSRIELFKLKPEIEKAFSHLLNVRIIDIQTFLKKYDIVISP